MVAFFSIYCNTMSSFWQLKLNKTYTFHGSYSDLEARILLTESPIIQPLGNNAYRFKPFISVGTLHVIGLKYFSIYVNATINSISDNIQEVKLTTNVRPESILIVLLSTCIAGISVLEQNFTTALISIPVCVIIFVWFHVIYRLQENSLIEKIENTLDLLPGNKLI